MTFVDRIETLPEHQRRAAQALYIGPDEHLIADAVHADVPLRIISYLTGLGRETVVEVTESVDDRDRRLEGID